MSLLLLVEQDLPPIWSWAETSWSLALLGYKLGLILYGLNLLFAFTSSTSVLPYYGLIKLSLSFVRRRAKPDRALFFCLDMGRATLLVGLRFFLISTTSTLYNKIIFMRKQIFSPFLTFWAWPLLKDRLNKQTHLIREIVTEKRVMIVRGYRCLINSGI